MSDQCLTQWCHCLPTPTGWACASAAYQGIYLFIAMVSHCHLVKEDIYLSSPLLLYLSIKWSCKDFWKRLSVTSPRLTSLLSTTNASFLPVISLYSSCTSPHVFWFCLQFLTWHCLKWSFGDFIRGKSLRYNLFIRERYRTARHAVPLIKPVLFFSLLSAHLHVSDFSLLSEWFKDFWYNYNQIINVWLSL